MTEVLVTEKRWFPELEADPPAFDRVSSERIAERDITKYILSDVDPDTVNRAIAVMQGFLATHRELCPVFPQVPPEEMREMIVKKPYLIINGNAVCLAKLSFVKLSDYSDRFFSEGWLKHPVRCSQNHILEQKRARLWKERMGDMCPVSNHPLGDLRVDEILERDIARYRDGERIQEEKMRRAAQEQQRLMQQSQRHEQHLQVQALELQIQQIQIANVKRVTTCDLVLLGTDAGKIMLKVVSQASESSAKKAANVAAKELFKSSVKKIPLICLAFGVVEGGIRLRNREYVRGIGAIGSGIAGCFPGIGTASSVIVDLCIAIDDVYEALPHSPDKINIHIDLPHAYQLLAIDMAANPNPTKEEVDRRFREQMRLIHPDALRPMGESLVMRADQFAAALTGARDFIYQQRNWA